jgi:predicted permease
MFDRPIQDLRFALRQLLRHRTFSALLVLTISVAIGANVAIFSVLEGIVLRPLPYADAHRLLALWERPEGESWHQPFTGPDYLDVRAEAATLEEVGLVSVRWANLSGDEQPVRIRVGQATASLFQLLGVQPAQGRLFTEEEELEGAAHVAVVSHALWRTHFGEDPGIVGRQVMLNGEPTEIVGVMPPSFRFPTPWGGPDRTRLWTPLQLDRDGSGRGSHQYGAFGRMADEVTPEQVDAELDGIALRLAEAYPDTNARTRMWTQPLMARTLGGISSVLVFLLVIVGLVLVIACANVASMLLARGMNRAPEFAIRASMGAGRRGLVRQLLTESLLLAVVGGTAGILLAYVGIEALKAVIPDDVPRAAEIQLNMKVLGFAGAVTLFTGALVGLAPALFASRANLAEVIKHGRASRGGGRSRFLSGLVTAQLGTGFVLVNAALVMAVSYRNVIHQPMNFDTDEVLVASISLNGPAYEEATQRRAFWEDLTLRARNMPGVVQAGVTNKIPLRGGSNGGILVRDEIFDPEQERYLVEYTFVDEGYHEAMGIPFLAGRGFTRGDMDAASVMAGADSALVELPLVINRALAEKAWPEGDALGELVRPNGPAEWWRARVVGIVDNVRQWSPEREPIPEMFFPHTAEVWGPIWGNLVVRTAGSPELLVASVRDAVRQLDPGIPVAAPLTMGSVLREETAGRRFSMLLVSLFAATALLLIVAGTYGVMSYGDSQRIHEIGVRMTLGAHKGRVTSLFLGRAGVLVFFGLVVGAFGAWAASRLVASMVYGIGALSPLYLGAAAAVMVLVALGATLVPVRRATAVDPLEALRVE